MTTLACTRLRLWMLISFGLLVAVTVTGCESGDSATVAHDCYLGDERSCTVGAGCVGVQSCHSNGTWGDCGCRAESNPYLGGACSDESACPVGATCLLPDSTAWLGGGPPQGLCVADCSEDVSLCDAFAEATCVSASRIGSTEASHAFCLPRCNLNAGTTATLACAAVPSAACEPVEGSSEGFCRPFCIFDSDCPSAHCDRQVGVCLAEAPPPQALAFGQTCNPTTPSCDGVCLRLSSSANICSNRCVFGSYSECATQGATPAAGVCAYATAQPKPGNIGYCTPLCNCNDDCVAIGFVCQSFASAATQAALGHVGTCIPMIDSTGARHEGVACSAPQG